MAFHPAPSRIPAAGPGLGYRHGVRGALGARRVSPVALSAMALLVFGLAMLVTLLVITRPGTPAAPHVQLVPPVYVQHAG